MLDSEGRTEKVFNLKANHDNYMSYARGLLEDTRGRLSRMNKLSEEVNFLANKIQPSCSYQPWFQNELEANGEDVELGIHESTKGQDVPMRKRSCPELGASFSTTEAQAASTHHSGVNMGSSEPEQRSRSGSETFLFGKKRIEDKMFQRLSDNLTQRKFLHPKTSARASTKVKIYEGKTKGIERSKPEPKKRLKLRVVIPGCTIGDEVSEDNRNSNGDKDDNGFVIAHPKPSHRESLSIPRVNLQGLSSGNNVTEIRLPKIMDKFRCPLQLTAKYRLPALQKTASQRT